MYMCLLAHAPTENLNLEDYDMLGCMGDCDNCPNCEDDGM